MAVASKIVDGAPQDTRDYSRRAVRGPVGWLLGPELLGKIKKILRKRSDPRDWMPYYRGAVHDECWRRNGALVTVVPAQANDSEATVISDVVDQPQQIANHTTQSAERVIVPRDKPPEAPPADKDAIWFDYIADMGDAVDSMYAVAYASLISFDGYRETTTWPKDEPRRPLVPAPNEAGYLKRGQFLFIGGDTAYHVADEATLRSRVEEPFHWAFNDAKDAGHVRPDTGTANPSRRIYGIPGNHDWYDNLEGFALVLRLGSPSEGRKPIELPDLERVQLASYVAIQLPYGWQFWGLDIDSPMDSRQLAYFKSLGVAQRLIVATPSPAIVFGTSSPDEGHKKALEELKIALPDVPVQPDSFAPKYRLDLSGDVHHYARYYPRVEKDVSATAVDRTIDGYGSVVSGLGGAFHHPTFTRSNGKTQVSAVCEYPTCQESLEDIGRDLLTWRSTWFGSWARIIPFILTLVAGFSATYATGGSWLLDTIWGWLPNVDTVPIDGGKRQLLRGLCAVTVFGVAVFGVWLGFRIANRAYNKQTQEPQRAQNIIDLWHNRHRLPHHFLRQLVSFSRSYWAAWTIAGIFIAPFILYSLWGPDTNTLRLDIATLVIIFVLPVAAAFVGLHAAKDLKPTSRARVTVVGLLHGLAHIVTAVVLARVATVNSLTIMITIAAIVVSALALYAARPFFKSQRPICILALAVLAFLVFVGTMAGIIAAANGEYVTATAEWYWDTARFVFAGVLAMPLGTIWFIWYLAVAGRLDTHNNEVGGAARVTKYRQFIRFHVHAGGITGYVIAIENTSAEKAAHVGGKNLKFELVDVFTVVAPVSTAPALTAVPITDDALEDLVPPPNPEGAHD